jgi:glycosyltransferase involved in cell wall biosynthesis
MKKNILFAVYNMEIGGIERSLINMLRSFDYERYNVDLFIYDHSGELLNEIPKEVNVLPSIPNYSVFRRSIKECVKDGHISTSIIRMVSKLIAIAQSKLKKLKEGPGYIQMQLSFKYSSYILPKLKDKYDTAISYSWPHDIIARNINATKKIAWIHTDYSKLEINHSIDIKGWELFDHIVSISEDVTKSFISKYPSLQEKIILCENITNPKAIKELAMEEIKEFNSKFFNILSVGRLSYVKGFDIAIKALKILYEKGLINIKWYVIGYGGYEEELRNLIREHDLEDSFILLGKKLNPYPYIKQSDLFVQPSRYEGKAVTVTEAKILGKPILLTNYPTAHSQLEDKKEGIICELNPGELANGIEEIYHDHLLRNNLNAYLINQNFSNKEELEKLYELLEKNNNEEVKIVVTNRTSIQK